MTRRELLSLHRAHLKDAKAEAKRWKAMGFDAAEEYVLIYAHSKAINMLMEKK